MLRPNWTGSIVDIRKLIKVIALFNSPSAGERDAAIARAAAMLKTEGKTFLDLQAVLASAAPARQVWQPPSYEDFSARWDDDEEARNPGHKARQDKAAADERRRKVEYRAAVIAKYGSAAAALEPDEQERAIDIALAPLVRDVVRQDAGGSHTMTTLDGWHVYDADEPSEHVAAAIRSAWLFPQTIPAAKAEADYWTERSRERQAISDMGVDVPLSLPCDARRLLVDRALRNELRAQSLSDIAIRQRMIVEAGMTPGEDELVAVLADIEHLIQQTVPVAAVHNGHPATATARRAEVIRLLSTLDTHPLSDREIARQIGVSAQTVGNIRRRLAAKAQAHQVAA